MKFHRLKIAPKESHSEFHWRTNSYVDLIHMQFSSIIAGHPHAQASSLKWPQTPDLNTRLRRLVAGYLKGCEKEQMKQAQAEKVRNRM